MEEDRFRQIRQGQVVEMPYLARRAPGRPQSEATGQLRHSTAGGLVHQARSAADGSCGRASGSWEPSGEISASLVKEGELPRGRGESAVLLPAVECFNILVAMARGAW
jgi:hypothetical protein